MSMQGSFDTGEAPVCRAATNGERGRRIDFTQV